MSSIAIEEIASEFEDTIAGLKKLIDGIAEQFAKMGRIADEKRPSDRMRVDWDPQRGSHINTEIGKGWGDYLTLPMPC